MINVKLTKISDNQNNLRTNEVIGHCDELPVIGKSFIMFGEGIEFGTRMVSTSVVKEYNQEANVFKTLNSQYKLELL